jgi:hypothetical protein
MTSSLVNFILLAALIITSICVATMYFKLKRFEVHHTEYQRIFEQTSEALSTAGNAIRSLNQDGREVLQSLEQRIDEARILIRALETVCSLTEEAALRLKQTPSD